MYSFSDESKMSFFGLPRRFRSFDIITCGCDGVWDCGCDGGCGIGCEIGVGFSRTTGTGVFVSAGGEISSVGSIAGIDGGCNGTSSDGSCGDKSGGIR